MPHQIFISYSNKDSVQVDELCKALSERSVEFWRDKNSMPMGKDFPANIAKAIEESEIVIFVASENAAHSEWVKREILYAAELKKEIITIRLDSSEFNPNLKMIILGHTWLEYNNDPNQDFFNDFTVKLLEQLKPKAFHEKTSFLFKQITDENDEDLLELLDIYSRVFDVNKNAAQEAIIKSLYANNTHHHSYLFILKKNDITIGFTDLSYLINERAVYISYIAAVSSRLPGERNIYTKNIADGLLNFFESNNLPIDEIIFDTENENLLRFFSRIIHSRYGFLTYQIGFDFIQPRILSDNQTQATEEELFNLAYTPLNHTRKLTHLSKDKVILIITSIYHNIFLEITDGRCREDYKVYLDSIISQYIKVLPNKIELKKPV